MRLVGGDHERRVVGLPQSAAVSRAVDNDPS
jgi:hypothetical protein